MTSVVTGAFGYIGQSITRQLIRNGEDVRTVTTHVGRPNAFSGSVEARPYDFDRPERLTSHLTGAEVLYNTYSIRFEHGGMTFDEAVRNTQTLFECARAAGIGKIVHISVTDAAERSSLPYYAGKARQERALKEVGVPYAILRPTVVFGPGDILVNNIAWLMRHSPFFPIFGSGAYRLQPIFVDDLGAIAIEASRTPTSATDDVIGPEDFTFRQFVELIASLVRPELLLIDVPPWVGIAAGRLVGWMVGDVILTRDELRGLMEEMLTSDALPKGTTRFSEWAADNKDDLGRRYASELARHFSSSGRR